MRRAGMRPDPNKRYLSCPLTQTQVVPMLDALPLEEAAFYATEENILVTSGKSQAIFEELESQYGLLGGRVGGRVYQDF